MRFLIDENLPFSLVKLLQDGGHDVLDIAANPLRGSPDERLWVEATNANRVIVTRDLDFPFPQIKPYPPGLVLIRVPYTFTGEQITKLFAKMLVEIPLADLNDNIIVVSPGRVRVRPLKTK